MNIIECGASVEDRITGRSRKRITFVCSFEEVYDSEAVSVTELFKRMEEELRNTNTTKTLVLDPDKLTITIGINVYTLAHERRFNPKTN